MQDTTQKAKSLLRRYKQELNLYTLAVVVVCLTPCYFALLVWRTYLLVPFLLILYRLLRRIIISRLYNRYVMGPLMVNMDAGLYRAMLEVAKCAARPGVDHLLAAYYNSDYQTVVDLAANKMADARCRRFTPFYLLILSDTYFDLGDVEALRRTIEQYDAYLATEKNGEGLRRRFGNMDAYRAFVEGRYEDGRAVCDDKITKETRPIAIVGSHWERALICSHMGDTEGARSSFRYIAENAPNLHYGRVAKERLTAMDAGEDALPAPVLLTPNATFTPVSYAVSRARRAVSIVTLVLIAILIVECLFLWFIGA